MRATHAAGEWLLLVAERALDTPGGPASFRWSSRRAAGALVVLDDRDLVVFLGDAARQARSRRDMYVTTLERVFMARADGGSFPADSCSRASRLFVSSVDSAKIGVKLDAGAVTAVASFLRVLNALENLRQAIELTQAGRTTGNAQAANQLVMRAVDELEDAREVLAPVKLHPRAVAEIEKALARNKAAGLMGGHGAPWQLLLQQSLAAMAQARALMVIETP